MATGGFDAEAAPNSNSDPSNINLLPAQNGLDNGGHLRVAFSREDQSSQ
jgi:hypothetical protein